MTCQPLLAAQLESRHSANVNLAFRLIYVVCVLSVAMVPTQRAHAIWERLHAATSVSTAWVEDDAESTLVNGLALSRPERERMGNLCKDVPEIVSMVAGRRRHIVGQRVRRHAIFRKVGIKKRHCRPVVNVTKPIVQITKLIHV